MIFNVNLKAIMAYRHNKMNEASKKLEEFFAEIWMLFKLIVWSIACFIGFLFIMGLLRAL
jgi:hypothetical protein